MSTKSTLSHGEGFHIYQEIEDSERVYLQVKVDRGLVMLSDNHLTLSLEPDFLTALAEAWLSSKDKFDHEPFQVDSQVLVDYLEAFDKKK